MKLVFSNYVDVIRKYFKNPNIALDELMRKLLKIVMSDFFDITPSDATHLMNRESEV